MPIAAPRHPHAEAASTVSTAWTEPPAGGAEVAEPYLLTTAVFDDSEPTGPVTSGVHTHTDALLVWPHTGSITLRTRNTVRLLLPGQGAWLPPGTPHAASHEAGGISCYTYVARRAVPPGWSAARPMRVSRALQEMLLHLDATAMPDDLRLRTQRVIIEMLEEDTLPAIEVPVPEDRRIQVLADDVMRDPESDLSVEGWAARHALSVRTVTRTFSRDVGMPFARWRSLVRMSAATALLAQGHPVSLVAHRSGYATTSAFCAAFRRVTGASPTEYLREQAAPAPAAH
ncbi:helix-turn-helix domain-containing protein [Streptomyces anulatus]|uniref:helix-turn-helix domain-containing protein n=1 Tax=Streptomyces anulatus TaxID=1892 RepID=UPI003864F83F|nr:AraC family transcriptional regulator [Streptomyces anulatus]